MRNLSTQIILMLLLAAGGYAQNIDGSMAGRVIDQQGAAIAGAIVIATEPSRKVAVTVKTNEQGDFSIAGLQPGTYTVSVQAPGFKKLDRTGIPLDANDKLAL